MRITLLEAELEKTKDLMMRTVAEAENGRKRALREREDVSKFAVSSFARDILSVADNLRRALDAIPEELQEQHPQIKNLTDGIGATERELLRCFEKNGIKKTDPLNERFDPHFHEVMFETPIPGKERGTIIQVIEPGYTLNGRILRPARVGIAKSIDQSTTGDTGGTVDTQA
ncbi:MAG: nucleotide exchange factor GrpE [Zetaproteobacteria bacterium]|nr:MAG: nucleotide exchange factor GrpE [Zetaproteobacteria bacterium]